MLHEYWAYLNVKRLTNVYIHVHRFCLLSAIEYNSIEHQQKRQQLETRKSYTKLRRGETKS